jgi:hypothetical protein
MAYSSTDLANVQTAIIGLATGTRVVSVTLADKTIEYSRTDIGMLEELRRTIKSELNSSNVNCMFIKTSKGL